MWRRRLKKPMTLFQKRPLNRTFTNLSLLSTSSTGCTGMARLPTWKQRVGNGEGRIQFTLAWLIG
jgi:hypothetical protein